MAALKPALLHSRSDGSPRMLATLSIVFLATLGAGSLLFAIAQVAALIDMLRISLMLILVKSALELRFYVRDSTVPFMKTSFHAWLIGLGGAAMPLMFRPNAGVPDFFVGTTLQIAGLAMQIYLIVTLSRDSGGRGAVCGIHRTGLFRIVRHPLLLAFLLSHFGYVVNHTTVYNMGVFALVVLLHVLRVNEEERLLQVDERYQDYADQTRWKFIPGMF